MTDKANSSKIDDSLASATKLKAPLRLAQKWHSASSSSSQALLRWSTNDSQNYRYKIDLYRFLSSNIPVISSCLWTWVRLAAAPGKFVLNGNASKREDELALDSLNQLASRMYANVLGNRVGLSVMLSDLLFTLLRDGCFGGIMLVNSDHTGVDQFVPIDPKKMIRDQEGPVPKLYAERGDSRIDLNRPDFYYIPFGNASSEPFGRSILQAIPFVSYIEQQLVDDMRRTSHNSGYHKLHVKVTPPERMSGESDSAYTERMNEYFDATVKMISSCEVDDNPVTWDNVDIGFIGPGKSREVTNSWFMSHRAMIEDICAGTNLAPYLLGYSYGATTSWAELKFDTVMRQVRSIQSDIAAFLEWIGNVHLSLGRFEASCRWEFDNTFSYRAREESSIASERVGNLLKLYEAGLIDQDDARQRARRLI